MFITRPNVKQVFIARPNVKQVCVNHAHYAGAGRRGLGTELAEEARDAAEEGRAVQEAVVHQIQEPPRLHSVHII